MESDNKELLEDELFSLEAIYPGDIEIQSKSNIRVTCKAEENAYINITLPSDYPRSPPTYEVCAPAISSSAKSQLAAILRSICMNNLGQPVLYLLAEAAFEFLTETRSNKLGDENKEPGSEENSEAGGGEVLVDDSAKVFKIISGPTLEDQKNVFQAHVTAISSKDDVPLILKQLKMNHKVAKATHNPFAWRIVTEVNGKPLQEDYNDSDEEPGAGPRIMRLLNDIDAKNVLVVVSRWYSGKKIGPARFRHMCTVARDALILGKFIQAENTNSLP